ncbi:hypothetical protein [Shigella boydii]|nr:hypothetical protein [Shigella boydii]MDS1444070.1 hypothetical protein [Shigella boydii]MDS1450588.1 hypothetical protein [Shigella boydii]MDS1482343.1 hypothetical protein [Shigella boydii]MDS1484884.1 hypothetical protein [Shigella boydii]
MDWQKCSGIKRSYLIAKKRAKERRSLSANGPITHAGSIDPLSGVSDI